MKLMALKMIKMALNEFYRQFPRTESMRLGMRQNNLYLILTKIYEQIDYNADVSNHMQVTQGSFQWLNGKKILKLFLHQIKTEDLKYLGYLRKICKIA
jgi:hypothetical protein